MVVHTNPAADSLHCAAYLLRKILHAMRFLPVEDPLDLGAARFCQLAPRLRLGLWVAVAVFLALAAPSLSWAATAGVLATATAPTRLPSVALAPIIAATSAPPLVTRFAAARAGGQWLTLAGPTDTPVMAPLILAFQAQYPLVNIAYHEMGGRALSDAMLGGQLPQVDVLLSSSVDSLIRLANDGYAQRHASPFAALLPAWARWRDEVFGFTFEPVVMVYNPQRFTEANVPRSRQALLHLLETDAANLQCRVGSYDIGSSSLGYLLAVQDEQVSSSFWGLMNAFGQVQLRLSNSSAEMIAAVERGELDLGYNVLGSYALARQAGGARIGLVFPQDYGLVLARALLITRHAPQPQLAREWVDWLLSPVGQQTLAQQPALGAIVDGTPGPWTADTVRARSKGVLQAVALNPTLLVGLDQLRQARFVRNWRRLVSDSAAHQPCAVAAAQQPKKDSSSIPRENP